MEKCYVRPRAKQLLSIQDSTEITNRITTATNQLLCAFPFRKSRTHVRGCKGISEIVKLLLLQMRFSLMKANYCSPAFILVVGRIKKPPSNLHTRPFHSRTEEHKKSQLRRMGKNLCNSYPEPPPHTKNNVILNIPALIQFRLYNKFFLFIFNIKK